MNKHRMWPLKRGDYTLTSGYGPRWGTHHSGLDFGAKDGTPIYACADGVVQFIGAATGYGQWIVIDHPARVGGGCTEYGHMWNAFATGLRVGSQVKRGQLIGYVGSNGQSTGPHLHLTVWQSGYGGRRVDPELWLKNAPHPGEVSTQKKESRMTLFGIDISNHQNPISLARVKQEGFEFVWIKATEGTWRDPVMASHVADAKRNGLRHGVYVYVRASTSARAHADTLATHQPDKSIPVALDIEANSGSDPVFWRAIKTEIERRGYRVVLTYLPRWYWNQVGRPTLVGLPPLWASNYPSTRVDYASTLYSSAGNAGWAGYGGLDVAMWQFSDRARVAGLQVDANAYRGTRAELDQLFTGQRKAVDKPVKKDEVEKMSDKDSARLFWILQQLAGDEVNNNGNPTWGGWPVERVIANGKSKLAKTGRCTPVEALFILAEDVLMPHIEEGKK